ncbi:MAG: EAL domain-containing protein [Burkholderiales bacterium]|nr:EAL domain-containing protein [Burkholderiales bacterium]
MGNNWYLEGHTSDGIPIVKKIEAAELPLRIGRDAGNDLVVDARGLSRLHAVIEADPAGGLRVVDLGSTNGTYVNRERIDGPRQLADNDVIHFGTAEFRVGAQETTLLMRAADSDDDKTFATAPGMVLSNKFVPMQKEFMELLRGRGLSAAAQPIVDAADGHVFAYELLGRSTHPVLPASPIHLFQLAQRLRREAELSEAFRSWGVAAIAPRLRGKPLFVNTHPTEQFEDGFFTALQRLTEQPGAPNIVVEIHETAVMEVDSMRKLAAKLAAIGVPFAYDDFGAGQSRLKELTNVPPQFVKFDMGLIRNIHLAPAIEQRVVRDLVRAAIDLDAVPLAEGVETEDEAAVCRDMGFRLIQGYLTGRPVPVTSI